MKFTYQGRTNTGQVQSGAVEASSKEAAFEILKSHGLYVTFLEQVVVPVYAREIKILEIISTKDIVIFSRQLAIMLKSRVPLDETFQTLAKQTKNDSFKEKLLRIAEEIEGGTSLSGSLSLYPKLFSKFYISMVKSGEASGKLTEVFLYLADYLEREYAFNSKIRGAMIYPLFIILVFLAVSTLMIAFVIPHLGELLKESNQQLPWITTLAINISAFLRNYWWLVLGLGILIIYSIYHFSRTDYGRKFFDRVLLEVPFLSSFLKKLYLTRFAMNLSTLISGGLPIVRALEITGDVVSNDVYKRIIFQVTEGVRRGEAISAILLKYPKYVSPFFYQMVVVGEKTGTLDFSLNNVITFYQRDIDSSLDNFIKLLEPVLIIFLGLVVGGLLAAVLMPIYSLNIT